MLKWFWVDFFGFVFKFYFTELFQESSATTVMWHEDNRATLQQVACARSWHAAAQWSMQANLCCFIRKWSSLWTPAAAAWLLLAPPQAHSHPTGVFRHCRVCFGLDPNLGSVVHVGRVAMSVFIVCGLSSVVFKSPWGTVRLVFWVILIKFLQLIVFQFCS